MNISVESGLEKQMFWARYVLMTLITVTFYVTGAFSILAFAPMTVALLLFGQVKGSALGLICFAAVAALSSFAEANSTFMVGFVLIVLLSHLSAYLIRRQLSPRTIFLGLNFGFAALVLVVGSIVLSNYEGGYAGLVEKMITGTTDVFQFQSAEQAAQFREQVFELPLLGVKQKFLLPALMVLYGAFQLWLGVVFVLRFAQQWRQTVGYHSSIRELIHFKNPEWMIYPVLGLISLLLIGHHQKWEAMNIGVISLLFFISFFYFLQGFGVYADFLRYLRLRGLMRILFVFVAVVFMHKLLAIVGFFDLWINFRKFFKKQIES